MAQKANQNIALIGFMAVGKSAVGRNLAKKLGRRFVDLDRLIEKSEGLKISEIFEQKGELYFRQVEKETLQKVLGQEDQVIATGGGVVMDDDNLALLREKTILVGLSAALEVILSRAGNGAKRPLLKGANRGERVEALLKLRAPKYARAHLTVDTSGLTPAEVAGKIIAALESAA